jgi:hypothetical protein
MAGIEDIITFVPGSGLDWDSEHSAVKKGDSRRRLNAEIREGYLSVLTNARGNDSQSKSLPAGTNEIVGWIEDKENNAFIYCVYNSNADHCIIRYNYDETFDNISYAESIWDFQSGYVVEMDIIGDGNSQQLILTDNYNPVRSFNVYNVENGVYSPLSADNINLAKSVYRSCEIIYTLVSGDFNYINGKLFEFRYKLVYDTGEESSWSQVYNPLYNDSETATGFYSFVGLYEINGYYEYDSIKFTINDVDADYVKIAFRYGDIGAGVWSVWHLADVIEVSTTNLEYYFYNEKNYSALDNEVDSDINLNYYDVPQLAKNVLTTSNNRICLFNVTKNYSAISLNVALEHVYKNPPLYSGSKDYGVGFINPTSSQDFTIGDPDDYVYRFSFRTSGDIDGERYFLPTSVNFANKAAIVDWYVDEINSKTNINITASNVSNDLRITNNYSGGGDPPIAYSYFNGGSVTTRPNIKSGQRVYFALAYYDNANRSTAALISDDTNVYIEHPNEYESLADTFDHINCVKYTITHNPPSWATHYQWLYGGSGIERFFQIPLAFDYDSIDQIKYGDDITDYVDQKDYVTDSVYTYLYLGQAKARILTQYPNFNIGDFDLKVGDIVRFVGYWVQGDSHYELFGEMMEREILDIQSDNDMIVIERIDTLPISLDSYTVILTEFYRPKIIENINDLVYYEVGDVLPITGGYHTATVPDIFASGVTAQNQTAVLPAIGVIDFGDCYIREVGHFTYFPATSFPYLRFINGTNEAQSFSSIKDSRVIQIGRPNIVNSSFENRALLSMVWSGTFSEEGVVFNELNKFVPKNIRYLEDKYGEIYGAKDTGDVITILQERKVSSIGVGLEEIALQDGTRQLVAIADPFGQVRKMADEAGTIFTKSIVNNGVYIYFFDVYSYRVYRRAYNGLFPISDYGMANYFKSKSKALLGSGLGNIDVVAGWDGVNKMYIMTFIDSSDASNNETIAFHEPTNRWMTFYSFIPDLYARLGNNVFLTFKNNVLYKHHSETQDRGTFYGVAYNMEVDVISNINPLDLKRYKTIKIDANDIFYAPDEDAIEIYGECEEYTDDTYEVYDADMVSSLPEACFTYDNGEYKAAFLRDAKTTSDTYKIIDLFEGRPLKGKWIKVRLENSNTDNVYLRCVKIKASIK